MKDVLNRDKHIIRIREGGKHRALSLEQDEFVIGREESQVEVCIASSDISRKHVAIRISGNQVYVRDLKSGNGTFVDGARLQPEVEILLKHEDETINVGNIATITITPRAASVAPVLDMMAAAKREVEKYKSKAIAEIEAIQADAVEFSEHLKAEAFREIEGLRSESESLHARLAELREEGHRHEALAAECADFEERAAKALSSVETLDRTATGLSEEITDAEGRITVALLKAEEQEAHNSRLERDLDRLKDEVDSLQVARQEKLALEVDVREKSARRASLERELDKFEEKISGSRRSFSDSEDSLHRIDLKKTEALATVKALEHDKSRLATERDRLKKETDGLYAAKQETLVLEKELSEKSQRRDMLAHELEGFEIEVAGAKRALGEVEALLENLKHEKSDAEGALKALVQEASRLASERDGLKEETNGLHAARKEKLIVEKDLIEKSANRDSLFSELTRLEAKLSDSQRAVSALEDSYQRLELKKTEALAVVKELEQEGARLAAIKLELSGLGEALEREKQVQFAEERRSKAQNEAQEAEFVVRRLTLEAALGEVDLKRIEGARELQALLDQQRDIRRDIDQSTERMAAFEKTAEAIRAKEEIDRAEARQLKFQLVSDQASLAELHKQTAQTRDDLSATQAAAQDFIRSFETEKSERRAQLSAEIAQLKQAAQDKITMEFAERGRAMERELADAKLKELNQVARMQEEERKAARARLQFTLDEIVKNAIDLTRDKPIEQAEKELRMAVKASLEGRTPSSRSTEGAERTRQYWRKKGLQAAVPIAAGLFFVIFPGMPGAVRDRVLRTIASEKNESGIFLDQIRQHGMKYQPDMDRNYRDTYAANLLYLEDYAEMKLSAQEEKGWTLILNDLIIGRLGLSDRVIPEFISVEAVMVRELFRIREGMLPQYLEQGLAHLAEAEKQEGEKLLKLLQTPENYQKFRDLEKSYYLDFVKRKAAAATSR